MKLSAESPELEILLSMRGDSPHIERVIREVHEELSGRIAYRFIVCEERRGQESGNSALETVKSLARTLPIRVLSSPGQRNYSQSMIEGMRALRAHYLWCLDSDGQCDPRDFWKFWDKREEYDFSIGWRRQRADSGARTLVSRCFHQAFRFFFRSRIHDPSCPFVFAHKAVIHRLSPLLGETADGLWWEFSARVSQLRLHYREIPLNHRKSLPGAKGGIGWTHLPMLWRIARQASARTHAPVAEAPFFLRRGGIDACAILTLAVILVFGATLGFKFVSWGDDPSFHKIAQLNPVLLHVANIAIHALSAIWVFRLIRLILGTLDSKAERYRLTGCALGGALLFALHPVQAELVSWITGLEDMLPVFLCLVSLELLLKSRWAWAFALFLASLCIHSTPIILPLLAFLIQTSFCRVSWKASARRLASWGVVALPFIFIHSNLQAGYDFDFVPELGRRLGVLLDALGFGLFKVILPFGLSPLYGRTPDWVLQHRAFYWTAWIPLALGLILFFLKDRRAYFTAYALFLIPLLPASTVSDRGLYLPMMGISLIAAIFLFQNLTRRTLLVMAALALALGARTADQIRVWRDGEHLYRHVIELHPELGVAHASLGSYFKEQGRIDEARHEYEEALRTQPGNPKASRGLAAIMDEHDFREANELAQKGEAERALRLYQKILSKDPRHFGALSKGAVILAETRRYSEAIAYFQRALILSPQSASIYLELAHAYEMEGRREVALAHYQKALELDPGNLQAKSALNQLEQVTRSSN